MCVLLVNIASRVMIISEYLAEISEACYCIRSCEYDFKRLKIRGLVANGNPAVLWQGRAH